MTARWRPGRFAARIAALHSPGSNHRPARGPAGTGGRTRSGSGDSWPRPGNSTGWSWPKTTTWEATMERDELLKMLDLTGTDGTDVGAELPVAKALAGDRPTSP